MSYPKKLLRLRPTKGIVSDTPPHEVGAEYYTSGQNVIFRDGFASRILGSRSVYGPVASDVYHLRNVRINGTNFWLALGAASAFALEGSNDHDIEGTALTTITQPWQWASTVLNGIPVVTNGVDLPQYWDGNTANNLVSLPGWPATTSCKSIAAYKYHLFALDIDGPGGHFESQVKWSHAAEPGTVPSTWVPAADNEAGDTDLSDSPGAVLTAVPCRGDLLIYKPSATYAADYAGGNQKFIFNKMFASSGALTRHAVCDVNGQHFVVTGDDIILTDGTNRRSIGEARMKSYLFSQISSTSYENLFVVFNRQRGEVLICFPEVGATLCTQALVYDIAKDAFGLRDLPNARTAAVGAVTDTAPSQAWDDDSNTWDSDSSTWNDAGAATATESLVIGYGTTLEVQDTTDNVSLAASVGRYDLTFDAPERVKFVKRLHVRAKSGFGTLLARVGSRMSPSGTITWSPEVTLTEPDQIVNTFCQGRYISFEIRSTGSSVWTITGVDLEAELRGYH